MELRQLKYFVAIAEEGSFHRAAERLHVAQPALSRQVRNLEDEIGLVLFDRLQAGVALTSAGRSLLQDMRSLLGEIPKSVERARQASLGVQGSINLSFTRVSMRHAGMADFFRGFREAYPNIELKLSAHASEDQIEALWNGAIDAAFITNGADANNHGFSSLRIDTTVLELIVASSHRLANMASISMADLRDEPFLLPSASVYRTMRTLLMKAFLEAGYTPHVVQELENDDAIIHLVAAGFGLSFMRTLVRPVLPGGVVMRSVQGLDVRVPIDLIWRRDSNLPALRHFIEIVRAQVTKTQTLGRAATTVAEMSNVPAPTNPVMVSADI